MTESLFYNKNTNKWEIMGLNFVKDLSSPGTPTDSYTKTEVNNLLSGKLDSSTYNSEKSNFALATSLDSKLGKTEKAADSDKLDGLDSSNFLQVSQAKPQNIPNTIVQRDANGDFAGRLISAVSFKSTANSDDSLIDRQSGIMYWSPNDKFIRPASLAKFKEILELPSNGIVSWGSANKPNGFARLDNKGKISSGQIPNIESLVILENTFDIDLTKGKNFVLNVNDNRTGGLFFIRAAACIGQSGIIVVKHATKIEHWSPFVKWREVPTSLQETEVFAYFIVAYNEIYMGRA